MMDELRLSITTTASVSPSYESINFFPCVFFFVDAFLFVGVGLFADAALRRRA